MHFVNYRLKETLAKWNLMQLDKKNSQPTKQEPRVQSPWIDCCHFHNYLLVLRNNTNYSCTEVTRKPT